MEESFLAARPVWARGSAGFLNDFIVLRGRCPLSPDGHSTCAVASAWPYRLFVDGRLAGWGPARGPHGYFRVDRWALPAGSRPDGAEIRIEAAGCHVNSYYFPDQPAFVQAEVVSRGAVQLATEPADPAVASFLLFRDESRVRKIQRYSFQRMFAEGYRSVGDRGCDTPAETEIRPAVRLLPRRVPYPRFDRIDVVGVVETGLVRKLPDDEAPGRRADGRPLAKDRSLVGIGPTLRGFHEPELEWHLSDDAQRLAFTPDVPAAVAEWLAACGWPHTSRTRPADFRTDAAPRPPRSGLPLPGNRYAILDLGANRTGFLRLRVRPEAPCRLFLLFDEILSDGDVDFMRLSCCNAVRFDLAPSRNPDGSIRDQELLTFEPYTLRWLKAVALDGPVDILEAGMVEVAAPTPVPGFLSGLPESHRRIGLAAWETYRQNAVDVFTDCPSRERAGWLCDSFFTARTAWRLTGSLEAETLFLENFLLAERVPGLDPAMFPMCYPADHDDGVFIPNWGMWLVLQLEEFAGRSGDPALVEAFRPKVLAMLAFLKRFENRDGLLERLPSWVFVEWSRANDFVQDINYPTNMLYAATLETAGRLYGDEGLLSRAGDLKSLIRRRAFRSRFFRDHDVYVMEEDGSFRLDTPADCTETCQYYAFFTGIATPESHPWLWTRLVEEFGPERIRRGHWMEVHPSNAFIGNFLRLECLWQAGLHDQVRREVEAYFDGMAIRTGTLWEHDSDVASCCHGFASHVLCWLGNGETPTGA